MKKEMLYSDIVDVYEKLGETSGRLDKTSILAEFLRKLKEKGESSWIYLLRGKVTADYDSRETGISGQLTIKAISKALGIKSEKIVERYRKIGDLGEIAEEFISKKKQETLFNNKLSVEKVYENIRKIMSIDGKGSVDKKMALVSELLGNADGKEAKYIVRTLIGDLRVGIADGVLRDAIAEAFFSEDKKEMAIKIEKAYDLSNDFAEVFEEASKGKTNLEKIEIKPGRALKVMLPIKVGEIKEAFRICGIPCAIEHKYDGFRVVISYDGKEIKLFTRRLEEVTKQFPDVVSIIKKNVIGKSFIFDSEVVGYDRESKKYKPFEAISQRIRRKYDIDRLEKELPVEVNIFDVLYYNGKSLLKEKFKDRRKILEKAIKEEKLKIRPSFQIITDNEKEALRFYKDALKGGEEGIMVKKLDAEYRAGRRVGYIVKIKPDVADLDLVIVGAEYGSGKRAGGLTSYIVACRNGSKFLEVGKVSSGLKEKEEIEGTSYKEMDKLLRPLIIEEKGNEVKVKPKVVVSVTYQNIQESPSYSSGFAMRFPRITHYRPDYHLNDIASLEDIKKEVKKMSKKRDGKV